MYSADKQPKWGFLPPSEHIHPQEAASIKSEHSRYKLHQHMRGIETEYDPLDLYSGDMSRMDTAMQALWALWSSSGGDSNNWRVFVDGQVIGVHEVGPFPLATRIVANSRGTWYLV
jgi:inositol-pentakisphosphate 2-kinase